MPTTIVPLGCKPTASPRQSNIVCTVTGTISIYDQVVTKGASKIAFSFLMKSSRNATNNNLNQLDFALRIPWL